MNQTISLIGADSATGQTGSPARVDAAPQNSLRVSLYPGSDGGFAVIDPAAGVNSFSFGQKNVLGTMSVLALQTGNATGTGLEFFQESRAATMINLQRAVQTGAATMEHSGHWSQAHEPAVNVQASTVKAAGGVGFAHVCTGFSYSLMGVAAITAPVYFRIRNGASGAGTVLWSVGLIVPLGTCLDFNLSGLSLIGSDNTAMTAEFSAAPGATNFESVSLTGYTAG